MSDLGHQLLWGGLGEEACFAQEGSYFGGITQSCGSQRSLHQKQLRSLLKQSSGPHPPSEFLIH